MLIVWSVCSGTRGRVALKRTNGLAVSAHRVEGDPDGGRPWQLRHAAANHSARRAGRLPAHVIRSKS